MSHARAVDPTRGVTPLRRRPGTALKRRRSSRLSAAWRRIGGLAVLTAALVGAGSWALTSPRFAVARIDLEVDGAGKVDAAWAEAAIAPLVGSNVFRLSIDRVEEPLAGHPWIEQVAIRKELPDRLAVRVLERRPAALVPHGETWWLTDAHGRAIAPLEGGPSADEAGEAGPGEGEPAAGEAERLIRVLSHRPRTTRKTSAEAPPTATEVPAALALARRLAEAQPAWAEELREIRVLGEDDFSIVTGSLPFELLVRGDELDTKTATLARLLPDLGERYEDLAAVDLRLSRRIVLKRNEG